MNEFQPPASCSPCPERARIQVKRILGKEIRAPLSRLIEDSDGVCYRARFATTSESRRLLINQWIESYFLQQFTVSTTAAEILHVPPDIAKADPDLFDLVSRLNNEGRPLLCLGSRYPAHPQEAASFGLLPKRLWSRIVNLGDLATTFVLDQLLGMNRFRRILFTRNRPCHPNLFRAYLVADGDIFGGSERKIENRLDFTSYYGFHPYASIAPAQWLRALELVGSHALPKCEAALAELPEHWLDTGERGDVERLFDQVQHRRHTLSNWIQIPDRYFHAPHRDAVQQVLKSAASVAVSLALSSA